jgi:hypothetical protein
VRNPDAYGRRVGGRRSGGLRSADPALSFAKLRSDKNQVQHLGSTFRAGSLQSLCRLCGSTSLTCVVYRPVDGSWNAGAAAVVPIVCRTSAGRRRADRSQSDVVMSGAVDSGRESGHGNIDANDPGCVTTHTSAKCRKYNSPTECRTSHALHLSTPRCAISSRCFYVCEGRGSFRTAKTQSGIRRIQNNSGRPQGLAGLSAAG